MTSNLIKVDEEELKEQTIQKCYKHNQKCNSGNFFNYLRKKLAISSIHMIDIYQVNYLSALCSFLYSIFVTRNRKNYVK